MNICSFCNKDFKYSSRLIIHLNSNKPCFIPKTIKNVDDFLEEDKYDLKTRKKGYIKGDDNLFYCLFCNKSNEKQRDICTHVKKFCHVLREKFKEKFKQDNIISFNKNYTEIEENITELYDFTLKILPFKNKIVELGKEDLTRIAPSFFVKNILSNYNYTIQKLNNYLSFNHKVINQWNIHYLKDGNILYFKDEKWNIKNKDEFIDLLILIRQNQIYDLERDIINLKSYNVIKLKKASNRFDYKLSEIKEDKSKLISYKETIFNSIKTTFLENIINFVEDGNKLVENYFSNLKV